MTRLFLRFYLGVIAILIAAGMIQAWVSHSDPAEYISVIERAYSGGARLARDQLMSASEDDFPDVLADIQTRFDFPIRIVPADQRQMDDALRQRLRDGEVVFYWEDGAIYIETELPDSEMLLEYYDLPIFPQPSQTERTLGLLAILGIAALAIAILLRPIVAQLRGVEKAATAIASGELSTRIQTKRWRRELPLESAFNSMAERTETLVQSQRQLLQAVSHELRTPLARIRFATDLIETSTTKEERQQRLQAVDEATEELDKLVGELLTYVRLESEKPIDEPELIDLEEFLDELVASRRLLFPKTEFSVSHSDQDIQIVANRASLSRAIGNLVNNAGRFAKSHVRLSLAQDKSTVTILVDDDGTGVLASDRERIFEPFVSLDSTNGTGLGLALVQRIASASGGSVLACDNPAGGARFKFTIPRC